MRKIIEASHYIPEQRNRFRFILEFLSGDVTEIGAGYGESTIVFLQYAEKYNKIVNVVDPFENGWDEMPKAYGEPYPKSLFDKNTEEYKDYLNIIQESSQKLKSIPKSCFVFVDGLQFKDAVLHDLNLALTSEANVICIDDVDRLTGMSEVPLALKEFKTDYTYININKREGYFIK